MISPRASCSISADALDRDVEPAAEEVDVLSEANGEAIQSLVDPSHSGREGDRDREEEQIGGKDETDEEGGDDHHLPRGDLGSVPRVVALEDGAQQGAIPALVDSYKDLWRCGRGAWSRGGCGMVGVVCGVSGVGCGASGVGRGVGCGGVSGVGRRVSGVGCGASGVGWGVVGCGVWGVRCGASGIGCEGRSVGTVVMMG